MFGVLKELYSSSVNKSCCISILFISLAKKVSSLLTTSSLFVQTCLDHWKFSSIGLFMMSYLTSGTVTLISSSWWLEKLADFDNRFANIWSDWTAPYEFVLCSRLSSKFKSAGTWMNIFDGLLNVWNCYRAPYLVIEESFLNNLFKR